MEFGPIVTAELGVRAGDEMAARRTQGISCELARSFGDRSTTGPVRTLSFVPEDRHLHPKTGGRGSAAEPDASTPSHSVLDSTVRAKRRVWSGPVSSSQFGFRPELT